jgi:T5SS/PEP-CTERM-associated repeat protein/autotransporter-associated beta strand protein
MAATHVSRGGTRPPVRRSPHSTCRQVVLLCLCLPLLSASPAAAQVIRGWWPGNGDFEDPAKWAPVGMPGPLDTAAFLLPGGSQVTFASDPSTYALSVGHGGAEFLLDGHTYTVTSTSSVYPVAINVGFAEGIYPTLRLRNGTLAGQHAVIGAHPNGGGTVRQDTGAIWTNAGTLYVGYEGAGVLSVESGSVVTSQHGCIGLVPGSIGDATVTGAGSGWGTMNLSVGGSATAMGGAGSSLTVGGGGCVVASGTLKVWPFSAVTLEADSLIAADTFEGTAGCVATAAAGSELRVNHLVGWGDHVGSTAHFTLGHALGSGSGSLAVGAGQTLAAGQNLTVGYDAPATLTISAGGQVTSASGYLGVEVGSIGTVTVTGSGSAWTVSGSLQVGDEYLGPEGGTGTLNVSGGLVSVADALRLGDNGTVDVSGGNVHAQSLHVGSTAGIGGTGSLRVSGGLVSVAGTLELLPAGIVFLDGGTIATQAFDRTAGTFNWNAGTLAFTGDLLLDTGQPFGSNVSVGSGRDLEVAGGLTVGEGGLGALAVAAGGQVSSASAYVGYSAGSTGEVTVDGIGSTWTTAVSLYLGGTDTENGGDASLDVGQGARVCVGDIDPTTVTLGSSYGAVVVSDGDTSGGELLLRNGATLSNDSVAYLGYNAGETGIATVTGAGSTWTTTSDLFVGFGGAGTLAVTDGGQVSTGGETYVGCEPGSEGTVTVDGSGSTLTVTSATSGLFVGFRGAGTLAVTGGGQVASGAGFVGTHTGSTSEAAVDGIGSTWTTTAELVVGHDAAGTLAVTGGGQVSTGAEGYVGRYWGSTGVVTVDGIGSTWTAAADLYVGNWQDGTLAVTGGGQVSTGGEAYVGCEPGSEGTVTVDGSGSTLTIPSATSALFVGFRGAGTLAVTGGGQVASGTGFVGTKTDLGYCSTGEATVDGIGSTWTTTAELVVGHDATGTLAVTGGGQVSTGGQAYVGRYRYDGSGGAVTVEGVGSAWTITGSLYVGGSEAAAGGTGTVTVQNEGHLSVGDTLRLWPTATVTLDGGTIATQVFDCAAGTFNWIAGTVAFTSDLAVDAGQPFGATVSVGPDQHLEVGGNLTVGEGGGGTLTVTDGGLVSAKTLCASPSDLFGDGTITANGAVLDADLVFDSTHGLTQALAFGAGGTLDLNVDGTGSLGAGYKGTGTLRIADGLTVASTFGYLGHRSGSTGTALVTGAGSRWATTGSLYVGGSDTAAGGTGSVTVQNGGQLAVGETLHLWKADSTVTVNGGTLTAGALEGTTGTIRITDPAGGTALTVGSAASHTFSGTITDGAGPGSLTKAGAGTQTLTGANAYSGGTTVTCGTLRVVGGALGTGPVVLDAGTTLDLMGQPAILPGLVAEFYTSDYGGPGSSIMTTPGAAGWEPYGPAWTGVVPCADFPVGPVGADDGNPFRDYTLFQTDYLSARVTGYVCIPADGTYRFHSGSDDGSKIWVRDDLGNWVTACNNGSLHSYPGTAPSGNPTYLTAGYHEIAGGFYEATGWAGWEMRWDAGLGTDFASSPPASDMAPYLFHAASGSSPYFANAVTVAGDATIMSRGTAILDSLAVGGTASTVTAILDVTGADGLFVCEGALAIAADCTLIKTGPGAAIFDGPQAHGPGAILEILAGTVDLNTDASGTGLIDDADLSIFVAEAVLNFGCNQHLDTLTIDEGGLVRFTGAGVVVVKHLVMDGVDLGAMTLTPEPATLALLALGGLALLLRRRT